METPGDPRYSFEETYPLYPCSDLVRLSIWLAQISIVGYYRTRWTLARAVAEHQSVSGLRATRLRNRMAP